jgi:hypothetical protein
MQDLLNLIAATPEEKEAFIAEDVRRTGLLTGYVVGETDYKTVCSDWDFTSNAHWGFLGFSRQAGEVTIHFGRDIEMVLVEAEYGFASSGRLKGAMMGSCLEQFSNDLPASFKSDRRIQCTMTFEGPTLKENGCGEAEVLPLTTSKP